MAGGRLHPISAIAGIPILCFNSLLAGEAPPGGLRLPGALDSATHRGES
jgi:hypothetical protein